MVPDNLREQQTRVERALRPWMWDPLLWNIPNFGLVS